MSREDTHSRTEHDAERAEHYRATGAGEDTEPTDGFARPSTWNPADIPQHVWDDVRNAPTDGPPF